MSSETKKTGGSMPRRDALRVLGTIPAALTINQADGSQHEARHISASQTPAGPKPAYVPRFFTEHEWKTANVLADMIIPRDERSPGAAEVGAVEYIDEYAVFRGETLQTELRGGLMWLDRQCSRRFDRVFAGCTDDQRNQVLDLIAYPEKKTTETSQAIAFFNRFRDLTAGGFFTTKAGIEDLGYLGNRPFDWKGCPDEVLKKLKLKGD